MPRQYATLDAEGFVPQSQLRAQSYRSLVLDLGPVAYWRLGEASGTTMVDASGNGHDGTYVNAPMLGATGLLAGDTDTAVSFDGTDDHAQTNAALPTIGPSFTLKAWASFGATIGVHTFLAATDTADLYLRTTTSNRIIMLWKDTGGTSRTLTSPVDSLTPSETHLLAATHDGTTARLFVNGAQVASSAAFDSREQPVAALWSIGRINAATGWYHSGVIDEPAVFGRALTASESTALYEAGT